MTFTSTEIGLYDLNDPAYNRILTKNFATSRAYNLENGSFVLLSIESSSIKYEDFTYADIINDS